jgi:predicted site-specific integrase-resolvase
MRVKSSKLTTFREPDVVTIHEFARRLSVSVATARVWAYRGRIDTVRVGSRLQVPSGEILRIIAAGLRPRVSSGENGPAH